MTNNNIKEQIANFISPNYAFSFRLPHCQWDLRDVCSVKTNIEPINPQYKQTAEFLKRKARSQELESYGFGMILLKSQAEICNFVPSENWSAGHFLLGNSVLEGYYNPEPIISILGPLEKIYRVRTLDDNGNEVLGERYYPKPDEKIDTSKFIVYVRYLIALLDQDKNGEFFLLHDCPITFAPHRRSGIIFRDNIYEMLKTTVASNFSNKVAPFIFAVKMGQELSNWSQTKNPSKSVNVISMTYKSPRNREELEKSFVGTKIGKKLEEWFVAYLHVNMNQELDPPEKNSFESEQAEEEYYKRFLYEKSLVEDVNEDCPF